MRARMLILVLLAVMLTGGMGLLARQWLAQNRELSWGDSVDAANAPRGSMQRHRSGCVTDYLGGSMYYLSCRGGIFSPDDVARLVTVFWTEHPELEPISIAADRGSLYIVVTRVPRLGADSGRR